MHSMKSDIAAGASAHNNNNTISNSMSPEEARRQRRRRQLARKTPEQRRKHIQYQRRHNEFDGRLFYCDYCDLFVSSNQKVWMRHLLSAKHMGAVEGYYNMAAHVESAWLAEINEAVAKAHIQHMQRGYHAVAGSNAVTPLPAMNIAPHIVVGGRVAASPAAAAAAAAASSSALAGSILGVDPALPTIRVGNTVLQPSPACGSGEAAANSGGK